MQKKLLASIFLIAILLGQTPALAQEKNPSVDKLEPGVFAEDNL